MRAKCGACGNPMEIPGAGRFQCPACGQLNEVRPAADVPGMSEPMPPPPASNFAPPPAERPTPRVECPSCSFRFIVGDVESALCPNCQAEVPVRSADEVEDRDA